MACMRSDPSLLTWDSSARDNNTTQRRTTHQEQQKPSAEYDVFGHRATGRVNATSCGDPTKWQPTAPHTTRTTRTQQATFSLSGEPTTATANPTSTTSIKRKDQPNNGDIVCHRDTEKLISSQAPDPEKLNARRLLLNKTHGNMLTGDIEADDKPLCMEKFQHRYEQEKNEKEVFSWHDTPPESYTGFSKKPPKPDHAIFSTEPDPEASCAPRRRTILPKTSGNIIGTQTPREQESSSAGYLPSTERFTRKDPADVLRQESEKTKEKERNFIERRRKANMQREIETQERNDSQFEKEKSRLANLQANQGLGLHLSQMNE
eukprot:TRINITY_DN934_c0_g1_i3.p1 TRINITY_DN934_c0_g1~~TRINITY_DN934_c0_g1_i3.p1  ORF type:complete len:319 (+),score=106.68 TRINITY_DN934_c0_g1_i3:153-1109(+)